MSETLTIRLSGPLRRFIEQRAGDEGLYENVSEYVRDLVRWGFEREEKRKWAALTHELKPALAAGENAYEPFDMDALIAEADVEDGL